MHHETRDLSVSYRLSLYAGSKAAALIVLNQLDHPLLFRGPAPLSCHRCASQTTHVCSVRPSRQGKFEQYEYLGRAIWP